MKCALVWMVGRIEPHPNADRLEIVYLTIPAGTEAALVTGKHYTVGQLGVYVPSGALMPGILADQMWAAGKARCLKLFPVEAKNLRGVMSDGFFMGQFYSDDEEERERGQIKRWALWPENFNVAAGEDLTDFYGITFP